MKAKSAIVLLCILAFIVGTASADATSINSTAAKQSWTPQILKEGDGDVRALSTAFVGKNQVPMVSYTRLGTHRIYQAHKATAAVPGNCGPSNAWYCNFWEDTALVPGTVSPMATMSIIDTHLLKWVYSTGSRIRGATLELMNDMTYVDESWEDLIQISKFGSMIIGTPSLLIRGGHYEMAVTIRDSTDLYGHKLVYMHYTGNTLKNSCIDSGSVYQCDVIETTTGAGSLGAPSLQVAYDGTVGITYFRDGEGVKFAYPHTPTAFVSSNCGPGGNTWRCITVYGGTSTGKLGMAPKLAVGKTTKNWAIAYTYDDTLIPLTLYFAEYVGSGGNCGSDYAFNGILTMKWKCSDIIGLGDFPTTYTPSYSIVRDPDEYPVIAFDYASSNLSPMNLSLTYPRARIGNPFPGWVIQKIDGAPTTMVRTGAQAALSINDTGLGFISYLQEEDYELPDLKIAWQQFELYLPTIVR